jgi:hypothetical protein
MTSLSEVVGPVSHGIRGLIINLTVVILSFVVAIGLSEMYFRIFAPQPIVPRYVETSEFGIRKNIGHVRGRMIVPEYEHEFSTNSQGFRGTAEYGEIKPHGVYRVLVLGDSTTLGHGVGDNDTFSFLLEQMLSNTGRTEVINMGVSGFGTAEELIQLRNVGLQYAPNLVILGYFPNDPYNNAVSKLFKVVNGQLVQDQDAFVPALYVRDHLYNIPGWSFLCQHSHAVNFLRNVASGFFQRRLGAQESMASTTPDQLTAEESELTAALINEVAAETTRHGAKFILLNIPVVVNGHTIDNLPRHLINGSDSVLNIDVGKEVYAGHSIDYLSYAKDSHPKPLAHHLIADYLARYIINHVLPGT